MEKLQFIETTWHTDKSSIQTRHAEVIAVTQSKTIVYVAAILAGVSAFLLCVQPQGANDFWLQAKVGEMIVKNHTIPATVLFPFTSIQNSTFNSHEWLASVFFYGLITLVGTGGLTFVMGAAGTLLFAAIARMAYVRSSGNFSLSVALGLIGVAVVSYRHTIRPELVSLFCFVGYIYFIDRFEATNQPSKLALALVMSVLWTNTHGSFILAPLIAGTYVVGSFISQKNRPAHVIFLIAVTLCMLLNPVGYELVKFALSFGSSSVPMYEWLPTFTPEVMELRGFKIAFAAYVLTVAVMVIRFKKLSVTDILMFLGFSLLAFKAMRFMVYLGILIPYILAKTAPATWLDEDNQRKTSIAILLACTAIWMLVFKFGNAQGQPLFAPSIGEKFSQRLVSTLEQTAYHGNVINSSEFGSELIYLTYPRMRPSIDTRLDSYGVEYFKWHSHMLNNAEKLNEVIGEFDVQYMLLNKQDFGSVIHTLGPAIDQNWEVLSMDNLAVLIGRKSRQ